MGDASQRAKWIFLAALEEKPPEQWPAFLDQACAGDAPLRAEVEKLLRARLELGSFHEVARPAPVGTIDEPALRDRPGTVIGPYKLLEQIGEGGFGVVFMAEQTQPVRRKVALKVLKPGMDTRQVVARFEAERQALALMDHPNIARIFDGGTTGVPSDEWPVASEKSGESPSLATRHSSLATPCGRPYFVMELVKGVRITDFCNQGQLTLRDRLELFVHVCQAVQHAHQKGIIHRDIKPSNVLVTLHDGRPVPKVIDFGIAKAAGQQLTETTLFTNFAQMIGTPLYMSPEQAALSGLDVDTRSDIYSLGVLLYELLTGTTPFAKERFREADYDEIRRIIREEEPPRPSTRLSESRDTLASISAQRHTEPVKLTKLVRGELDWIVMKALEKDRNRRYETAGALAADVERYLRDEPVAACPPSVLYRLRKLARRNKAALLTVAAIAAAVLLAVASLGGAVKVLAESNAHIKQEQALTKDALEREKQANNDLLLSLEREKRTSYFRSIALAERELATDHVGHAEELLDECPLDLQGWEWQYLKRRRQGAPLTFRGHTSWVLAIAFSPDGKHIASASSRLSKVVGEIKVWDRVTGKELFRPLLGHLGPVLGLAYSPDGKLVASGGWDQTVKLWDAATGQHLRTLRGHSSYVGNVAFSPDSRVVASASGDGTANLWDTTTGQKLDALGGHSRALSAVAFSPDGTYVATASSDRTVKLWDTTRHNEIRTLEGQLSMVVGVAISRDGRRVASVASGGNVIVWDATDGRHLHTFKADFAIATSIAFNRDGSRLAVGSWDNTVRLLDMVTGQEALTLRGHTDMVTAVRFSPDGQQLASASMDGTVMVWDSAPAELKSRPESRTLRGQAGAVLRLAFSPDGKGVATANYDETVTLWNTVTGRQERILSGHSGPVLAVAFAGDGRCLGSADLAGNIKVWDATTGTPLRTFTSHGANMALSADGRRLAAGLEGGSVLVWDVATGSQELTFHAHDAPIAYTAISADGARVATASWDTMVKIWDATNGRRIHYLRGHSHLVHAVVFSQDGQRLASASWDKTAKIWDAATGKELLTLKGHRDRIISVAFNADGTLLATAGLDNNVKIWDAIRGNMLQNLSDHTGWVMDVKFSPDGKWLAVGGGHRGTGEVKLWDTSQWQAKRDGR